MKSDTLHLVLRYQWYDMVCRGEKTEEYRAIRTWKRRIGENVKFVVFHRGYSSTVMKFKVNGVNIGIGKPEWGAPKDKEVLIIKLGERLKWTGRKY